MKPPINGHAPLPSLQEVMDSVSEAMKAEMEFMVLFNNAIEEGRACPTPTTKAGKIILQ